MKPNDSGMKQSLLLTLVVVISSCTPNDKETSVDQNPFAGLWSLQVMEQFNPETNEWAEWRNGMQGYILYDNTENMSVHLTVRGYENTELVFPNFTDTISIEALKYLTNSYVYFAKYAVDQEQNIVQHSRISNSNPGEWNAIVRRRYIFSGDTLILQPLEAETSGLRLKWIKEKMSNKR